MVVLKTGLLPRLARPLDEGTHWRNRPLLGSHKTWRGIVLMVCCAGGFTYLQSMIERRRGGGMVHAVPDYRLPPALAGALIGLSYSLAELPNSFIKRQLGVPPGKQSMRAPWAQYVVDQTDSVIGCLVALRWCASPTRGEMAVAFVLGSGIHVCFEQLLHAIGVKRRLE